MIDMLFSSPATHTPFERIKDEITGNPRDLARLKMLVSRLGDVYDELVTVSGYCRMNEYRRQLLLSLLAYAAHRGVSVEQICEASNVSLDALTNGAGGLTDVQQSNLWLYTSKFCQDDLLGLHFGESLQLSALGAVGEIIKSSDTVGKALTVACSLVPLVTDLFTMKVTHDIEHTVVSIEPVHLRSIGVVSGDGLSGTAKDEFVNRQIADFLMMFTIHELDGLVLKRIVPLEVKYPFPANAVGEYARAFRVAPVSHDREMSITLPRTYEELPILSANYELQRVFLEKVSAIAQSDSPTFQERVRDFLMKNAYLGICSLEDAAANFNMTPRSMQRRLRDESVTFQQLADSVRKSLALYYLQSGKYQVKEISHILGYNELSAFSRAFKRWTGKTPVSY